MKKASAKLRRKITTKFCRAISKMERAFSTPRNVRNYRRKDDNQSK